MKVRVTKQDIKNGKPSDLNSCPIAKAIRRTTNTKKAVSVETGQIFIDYKPYLANKQINSFIRNFDDGKEVKPFTFELIKEL